MPELLLLTIVIMFEMFHHSFVSRLYMEIRDDLYHKNKKLCLRTILYRGSYTAVLCGLGAMFMKPLAAFAIVVGVRAVCVGYRIVHYRTCWFRNRVTVAFFISTFVALLFSASIAGAAVTKNPLLLAGIILIFPMRYCLERLDRDTHYQINRDKYDVDIKTARKYVERHNHKMESEYGHYITKAAERFRLDREVIKREIMMESMVRQSFPYVFFEFFMKLLPKKFPYPEGSTLGMAQASARLAKQSLELEELSLRDLLLPEVQIMAGAYLQSQAAKEYDANPKIAESKLQHIVMRYTGTSTKKKDLWNLCVFVEILREGMEKKK